MSETQKIIEIEVLRYLPESDSVPHAEVYKVPFTDDMSVLQGVQYIKDNLDGSLTYRWSCRMAICGSCGIMINGIPKLSCETFIRDYYPNRITVEALAHFPIEKDLVSDLSGFIEKLESVQPYIIPKEPRTIEQGEYLQTPKQVADYMQFTSCINCLLCYAACPQVGLTPDFIGPAAIALAHRHLIPHALIEPGLLRLAAVGGATTLVATLSWLLMERPINGLKRYFSYRPPSGSLITRAPQTQAAG